MSASNRPSLITVPAFIPSTALSALLLSPKKRARKAWQWPRSNIIGFWSLLLAGFGCLSMLVLLLKWHPGDEDNCKLFPSSGILLRQDHHHHRQNAIAAAAPAMLRRHQLDFTNLTDGEKDFWRQPKDEGYVPCLDFSPQYRQDAEAIFRDRRSYLVVVVSGGLNQQRNQIIDSVVIARILGAALVVPIMQVNVVWGDESEFSDIFDVDHFKRSLSGDVRIVSSLPSTHLMARHAEEKKTPLNASPEWFRSHYMKRLKRNGVLLLRGLDSRLSKDLPPDLQKLRCKVAFHALRFAAPIQELGDKIAQRMWRGGPYLALHLRLEKDVWVRTGCHSGLGPKLDQEIRLERKLNPRLLTGRSNMTQEERQLAGLCPLTAWEVVRLLKGLGASSRTRIYWAGGQPFGGYRALEPLRKEFPNLFSKQDLAKTEELRPFVNKASSLAALDYLVSLSSDVFMPSHGGNMAHALKGHRAYTGHRKHITPNKREMLPYFMNSTMNERDFSKVMRQLHKDSVGQPAAWMGKKGRDVLGYPVSECMCKKRSSKPKP